ncbi:hypothetical protein R6Q57_016307 [Mikania cordata]
MEHPLGTFSLHDTFHLNLKSYLERRQAEAARIREKYPDRIPVIVEKTERSDMPDIDKKKYLVPADLTVGQFVYVVRKRIKLTAEKAIFIFVKNILPPTGLDFGYMVRILAFEWDPLPTSLTAGNLRLMASQALLFVGAYDAMKPVGRRAVFAEPRQYRDPVDYQKYCHRWEYFFTFVPKFDKDKIVETEDDESEELSEIEDDKITMLVVHHHWLKMKRRKSDRIANKSLSRFKKTCNSPVEVDSDDDFQETNNDKCYTTLEDESNVRVTRSTNKRKDSSGVKGKGVNNNSLGDIEKSSKVVKSCREGHVSKRLKKKNITEEEDGLDFGVEWFPIVNKCSPKHFCKGLRSLKPKQRKAVQDTGFGKLLKFNVNGIPQKMGHYIVDKLDVTSMVILGRQGPIKVNKQVVFSLLGVPNEGIELKNVNPTRNLCKKIQEWRNLYPNDYISHSERVKRFVEAGDDDSFNFKVDFLMLFLSTVVECHAHGKCKLDVLNYLGDETEISKVNWCSYVINCIEKCKYGWLPNTKSPFKGALAILMGNMINLERMLEETLCNKKMMELAIVKKFEEEPNNHMACVVESLKEREYVKKNEETSHMSDEILGSGLANDIDDRIMDVCLEINRRRHVWIESEDEEEDINLENVDKKSNQESNGNKSHEVDFGCPSFSLGFTQEQPESKRVKQSDCINIEVNTGDNVCLDKTDNKLNRGLVVDQLPSFSLGLTQEECKQFKGKELSENMNVADMTKKFTIPYRKLVGRTKADLLVEIYKEKEDSQDKFPERQRSQVSGEKGCIDKQGSNLKQELVNDELPTFSLGLTQEGGLEDFNKSTDIRGREISENTNMTYVTQKMNAPTGKIVDMTKSEIETTKSVLPNSTKVQSLSETSDKHLDKNSGEKEDGKNVIQISIESDVQEKSVQKRAPKTDESVRLGALTEMMFEAVGRMESMRALKSYDIVIFPILENNHFYVMAFDLKNPGIYLLDNMDKIETMVSIRDHKDYYKKDTPYKVKHMFVKYLEKFQHPKAEKISMQKVTRVDLQWATTGNIIDCGVFAMRHGNVHGKPP